MNAQLNMTTYSEYIKYLENRRWLRERNVNIHENNSRISNTFNLDAGKEGTVLDIICPAGMIMSIPGIKDFPEDYDIDRIPYFELVLSNGVKEIDKNTRIKILKHRVLKKDEEICDLLYKDVNINNYLEDDNKFKNSNQLYRFEKMIELKGEDHLKIYVINPNIDIKNIKFNMMVDFWTLHDNTEDNSEML